MTKRRLNGAVIKSNVLRSRSKAVAWFSPKSKSSSFAYGLVNSFTFLDALLVIRLPRIMRISSLSKMTGALHQSEAGHGLGVRHPALRYGVTDQVPSRI